MLAEAVVVIGVVVIGVVVIGVVVIGVAVVSAENVADNESTYKDGATLHKTFIPCTCLHT